MNLNRLVLLALAALLAACQPPRSGPVSADTAARVDCREQVERQYNAQNRADLTRRDERDYAFAGTYNGGIASRGLGAEYAREQAVDGCLRAAGERGQRAGTSPGVGPAFSPANTGAGASSLRP